MESAKTVEETPKPRWTIRMYRPLSVPWPKPHPMIGVHAPFPGWAADICPSILSANERNMETAPKEVIPSV